MSSNAEKDELETIYQDVVNATIKSRRYGAVRNAIERIYRRLGEQMDQPFAKQSVPRVWHIHYLINEIAQVLLRGEVSKDAYGPLGAKRVQKLAKYAKWHAEPLFDETTLASSGMGDKADEVAVRAAQTELDPLQTLAFRNGLLAARRYVSPEVLKPILNRLPQSPHEQSLVGNLASALRSHLENLKSSVEFDHICIGVKPGTGSIISSLVDRSEYLVCFYGESSSWESATLYGAIPLSSARVLFIQDVILNTEGLVRMVNSLNADYRIMPVAIDALFSFVPCNEEIWIENNQLRVFALAWNDDLTEQFRKRRGNLITNCLTAIADNWETSFPAGKRVGMEASSAERKSSRREGVSMLSHQIRNYTWKASIGAYRTSELSAIKFEDDEQLKTALDMIWSKEELFDLPRQAGGTRTLVVPSIAISFFRGLRYSVYPVEARTGNRAKANSR